MKRAFLALSLALAPAAAFAGNYNAMPTPDQDQKVPVFAIACQDAQGRSLPPGSATCVQAQAQAVSGTVTANQGAPNAGGSQAWPVTQASQPLPANAAQETGGNLAAILARTPPLNAAGQTPVSDPNNAAYSAASATYATGATVTAGRAVYLNCSASGSVTMSLSGGGSLAYPVTAGANVLPFAVTSVSADTASCTHQNVN